MGLLALQGWSFIPGPRRVLDPPGNSTTLHEIASYAPAEVASAILAYPGVRLLHAADPTWWEWRAEWRDADRFITLGMTLFETDPPLWGGSEFEARCHPADVLALWEALRSGFPSLWLHNDSCEIHTPEAFRARFAPSGSSSDEPT